MDHLEQKIFELKLSGGAPDDETTTGHFVGMASIFGVPDLEGDVVAKGAFTKTLRERGGQVPLLWQHDRSEPIGLVRLQETGRGLQVNGEIDLEVDQGRRAFSAAKRRYVKGLSIGFDVIQSTVARRGGNRTLTEIRLWEVSLVTFAAQPLASVTEAKRRSNETVRLALKLIAEQQGDLVRDMKARQRRRAVTPAQLLRYSHGNLRRQVDELKAKHRASQRSQAVAGFTLIPPPR